VVPHRIPSSLSRERPSMRRVNGEGVGVVNAGGLGPEAATAMMLLLLNGRNHGLGVLSRRLRRRALPDGTSNPIGNFGVCHVGSRA
jgi:hypothetical protein